jgi:AcrR family transcriptional regulator
VIAEAALAVGDREGPRAMTMRRIATELGCDPMALYRHVADREALLDAVADRALAAVEVPDQAAPWEERVLAVTRGIRSAALAHPGITPHLAARPPLGRHGSRIGAALLAALGSAGLSPVDAVRTSQVLVAYLASSLAMAVHAGERDGRWRQVSRAVAALPESPPGHELMAAGSAEQFEYGLRLIVAGVRATVAAGE